MYAHAKRSWCRHAVFAGAILATAALGLGAMEHSARAQNFYGYSYGYPGTAYSYSPYWYPGYSYYPRYGYPHHWHGDWGHGGWGRHWSGHDGITAAGTMADEATKLTAAATVGVGTPSRTAKVLRGATNFATFSSAASIKSCSSLSEPVSRTPRAATPSARPGVPTRLS